MNETYHVYNLFLSNNDEHFACVYSDHVKVYQTSDPQGCQPLIFSLPDINEKANKSTGRKTHRTEDGAAKQNVSNINEDHEDEDDDEDSDDDDYTEGDSNTQSFSHS
jgi:hypothetical protein